MYDLICQDKEKELQERRSYRKNIICEKNVSELENLVNKNERFIDIGYSKSVYCKSIDIAGWSSW